MTKKKILSVDDSRSVHAFLEVCLQDSGFEAVHVYNGREAIERLLAKKETFDLILLDWEMPEMTGPETLTEVRSRGIVTPVVMLTTKNEINDITSMLEKGANEYVMKPFTREMILEKLQGVLEG